MENNIEQCSIEHLPKGKILTFGDGKYIVTNDQMINAGQRGYHLVEITSVMEINGDSVEIVSGRVVGVSDTNSQGKRFKIIDLDEQEHNFEISTPLRVLTEEEALVLSQLSDSQGHQLR